MDANWYRTLPGRNELLDELWKWRQLFERLVVALEQCAAETKPVYPSLDALKLSVRASNVLSKLNVNTVEQLLTYSRYDLLCERNCGDWTIEEIEEALARHNLKLAARSHYQEHP